MTDSLPFDKMALSSDEQLLLSQQKFSALEALLKQDWTALGENPERAVAFGWVFVKNTPVFLRWEERSFTDDLSAVRQLVDGVVIKGEGSNPLGAEAVSRDLYMIARQAGGL